MDLHGAYIHFPIAPEDRCFLTFTFLWQKYQFKVLPFGLSLPPQVFSRCVQAARVVKVLQDVDDWLCYSSIRQQTMQHAYDLLTHISKLSLRVISEKSSLTLRQVTHIISIQLDSAVASVTHRHMTDITKLTYKMQAGQHVWFQLLPTENARPAGHCRSRGALGPVKTKEFSEMSHFQRWVIILHSGEWCLLP